MDLGKTLEITSSRGHGAGTWFTRKTWLIPRPARQLPAVRLEIDRDGVFFGWCFTRQNAMPGADANEGHSIRGSRSMLRHAKQIRSTVRQHGLAS